MHPLVMGAVCSPDPQLEPGQRETTHRMTAHECDIRGRACGTPRKKTKVSLGEVREGFLKEETFQFVNQNMKMVSEFQSTHTNLWFCGSIKCISSFSYFTSESLYIFGLITSGRNVCFLYFHKIFVGL